MRSWLFFIQFGDNMAKKLHEPPVEPVEITEPVKLETIPGFTEGKVVSITDLFVGNVSMKNILLQVPDGKYELNSIYKLVKD
jgi:hypothetical protein